MPAVFVLFLSRYWQGCELLNQQAGDGEYLENIDVILGVMDMDNNDSIDINEFFEVSETDPIEYLLHVDANVDPI